MVFRFSRFRPVRNLGFEWLRSLKTAFVSGSGFAAIGSPSVVECLCRPGLERWFEGLFGRKRYSGVSGFFGAGGR